MRLLITGGSGFIGKHAVRLLAPHEQVLAPGSQELDLLDPGATEAYLREHKPDAILHTATWNATRTSPKDVSRVLDHNLRMYFHLLDARQHFGQILHYGSGAEFDRRRWREGMSEQAFGEATPIDDYGLSKFLIERSRVPDGQSCNLRLFGVFGPGEDWRIRFLSNACCLALYDRPLLIRQDRLFDYTWVEDVIQATRTFLHGEPLPHTVNLSAGAPAYLSQLARWVLTAAGKELPIRVADPAMGQAYTADTRRLRELHPEAQFTPLQAGVARLYAHYAEHRDEVDPDELC